MKKLRIAEIIKSDVANGEGIRLSIFVSGCTLHCKDCFNYKAQDFNYGEEYMEGYSDRQIFFELDKGYYDGITILGGEPFEYVNQKDLYNLIQEIKKRYPNLNIWMYTGFVYDKDLLVGGQRHYGVMTNKILDNIDILVDGPFIVEKRNLKLKFRGSENQRIIDMRKSRESNSVVLSELNN